MSLQAVFNMTVRTESCLTKSSGHFFIEKQQNVQTHCHLITKSKINKHTLTQHYYTLADFLVFSVRSVYNY